MIAQLDWLAFVVVALAAFRITRLITQDTLTLPLRERLYAFAWDDEHPVKQGDAWVPASRGAIRSYVYELVTCAWCMGFWVTLGVYSAWRWWDVDAVRVILTVFAAAGVQGLLASWQGD